MSNNEFSFTNAEMDLTQNWAKLIEYGERVRAGIIELKPLASVIEIRTFLNPANQEE